MKFKSNPLKNIVITSNFGVRFHPIEEVNKFHNGIDLRATEGTKLYAVDDGEVVVSKVNNGGASKGLGYYIVIQHKEYSVVYAHMKKLGLKVGSKVTSGMLIGYSGNSGASQAPHLHFEVRLGKYSSNYWKKGGDGKYINAVDPKDFLLDKEGDEKVSYPYNQELKKGMVGSNVGLLQKDLTTLQYYSMKVDDSYGNGSVKAVGDFQDDYGLKVTGVADLLTQQKIKEALVGFKPPEKEEESKLGLEGTVNRNWNLRKGTDFKQGTVLTLMRSGDSVVILDTNLKGAYEKGTNIWYKLEHTDNKGVKRTGFAHSYGININVEKGYSEYWLDRQTKIIKVPKDNVWMDVVLGKQPTESVRSLYNRDPVKGILYFNAGLFDTRSGNSINYLIDNGKLITEGVVSKYAFCQFKDGRFDLVGMNWLKSAGQLSTVKESIGASPPLVINGKKHIDKTGLDNAFINHKHPRIAFGVDDTHFIIVVVHGRNPLRGYYGIAINELADICLSLKMKHAINLDGGGSITVIGGDGKDLENVPDNRRVDSMIVLRRK